MIINDLTQDDSFVGSFVFGVGIASASLSSSYPQTETINQP